jgi:mannose-6-phosphate isomerase class I
VPENGLLFESSGLLLEVSFDCLMYHNHPEVLGDSAARFGYEFPIRFDFLDTVDGQNLSVQVHPRPDYIRKHFGETFTQDETYYILDCEPNSRVYLGFKEDIDPDVFCAELERSFNESTPIDADKFVNSEPANKHDLFLIPHGTIHCSGKGVLVLEISATPYIFTFKMYDWMRLDLDGKPRPINIDRAFANLNFSRQGPRVEDELISKPAVIAQGDDWQLVHLPTHADHFYDVHRFEFDSNIEAETGDSCHVMSLVEGTSVLL